MASTLELSQESAFESSSLTNCLSFANTEFLHSTHSAVYLTEESNPRAKCSASPTTNCKNNFSFSGIDCCQRELKKLYSNSKTVSNNNSVTAENNNTQSSLLKQTSTFSANNFNNCP